MSWILRAAWSFPFLAILAVVPASAAKAQSADIVALNQQAVKLHSQDNDKEATAAAENAVVLAQRTLGADHPDTLTAVSNLAHRYQTEGRHSEAEALYKRAVEARERVLGPEHPDTITSVNNLALLYKDEGRYEEAEPLYKRAFAESE